MSARAIERTARVQPLRIVPHPRGGAGFALQSDSGYHRHPIEQHVVYYLTRPEAERAVGQMGDA